MTNLKKACKWLKDTENRRWVKEQKAKNPDNQLTYLDAITPHFKTFIELLPPQATKLHWTLCRHYRQPTSIKTMVKESRLPYNHASAYISRLKKMGIFEKEKRGRYRIKDLDYLRFFAVRYDSRWKNWKETHKNVDLSNIVDQFIENIMDER